MKGGSGSFLRIIASRRRSGAQGRGSARFYGYRWYGFSGILED